MIYSYFPFIKEIFKQLNSKIHFSFVKEESFQLLIFSQKAI